MNTNVMTCTKSQAKKLFDTVKQEKQKRNNLRVELNAMKNKVQRKIDIKQKIENIASAK